MGYFLKPDGTLEKLYTEAMEVRLMVDELILLIDEIMILDLYGEEDAPQEQS